MYALEMLIEFSWQHICFARFQKIISFKRKSLNNLCKDYFLSLIFYIAARILSQFYDLDVWLMLFVPQISAWLELRIFLKKSVCIFRLCACGCDRLRFSGKWRHRHRDNLRGKAPICWCPNAYTNHWSNNNVITTLSHSVTHLFHSFLLTENTFNPVWSILLCNIVLPIVTPKKGRTNSL